MGDGEDGAPPPPALHAAVRKRDQTALKELLAGAVDVNADERDEDMKTALHVAVEMAEELALVDLLLTNGASLEAEDLAGLTPLHYAARNRNLDIANRLLNEKLNVAQLDKARGGRVLVQVVLGSLDDSIVTLGSDTLQLAQALILAGASWSDNDNSRVEEENKNQKPLPSNLNYLPSLIAAIQGWIKQRDVFGETRLLTLPLQVYDAGPDDVRAYFSAFEPTESSNATTSPLVYRQKMCVVGTRGWGKTTFIDSLTSGALTRRGSDQHALCFDPFVWEFTATPRTSPEDTSCVPCQYQVALWDFHRDVTCEPTQRLLYSCGSMYLLCVDLKAYADALTSAYPDGMTSYGEVHESMDLFVETFIYRWVREIIFYEPNSEFILVGTKGDLIEFSSDLIAAISDDLMARIDRIERDMLEKLSADLRYEADPEVNAKRYQLRKIRNLEQFCHKRFRLRDLVVVNPDDETSSENARALVQTRITESETAFLMPETYSMVAEFLEDNVISATGSTPKYEGSSIGATNRILSLQSVRDAIRNATQGDHLSNGTITAALHVLHCLGEILWFDSAPDVVFLDPEIMIELVRQPICHVGENSHSATQLRLYGRDLVKDVKNEGRVAHKLLLRLPLWKKFTAEYDRILQLKELLVHFNLAFPASGQAAMNWRTDLIVPRYWEIFDEEASDIDLGDQLSAKVCWEYELHPSVPDWLFQNFGVLMSSRYYSTMYPPTQDHFAASEEDIYALSISKRCRRTTSIIAIKVAAESLDVAWQHVLWCSMTLERLIDEQPGLHVARYAVSRNSARVEITKNFLQDGLIELPAADGAISSLFPPSMDWFTRKTWRYYDDSSGSDQNLASYPPKRKGDWTPFHTALSYDRERIASVFADDEEMLSQHLQADLMLIRYIAATNNVDLLTGLISKGTERALRLDEDGQTIVHVAAQYDSAGVVSVLAREGLFVDAKDKAGQTPLHVAASNNSMNVAVRLLKTCASVATQDENGMTPLDLAAQNGAIDVATLLVRKGATVLTQENELYMSSLHLAARCGKLHVGKLLLENGADPKKLSQTHNILIELVRGLRDRYDSNDEPDIPEFARILISAGALRPGDLGEFKASPEHGHVSHRNDRVGALLAAIDGWIGERDESQLRELSPLPVEVYQGGANEIEVYFESLVQRRNDRKVVRYRKKLCIVGPSSWGKTSFVKTLTTKTPTLEAADERTMGIDLFLWTFEAVPQGFHDPETYDVALWDFAGQDEYQSAHSLFFSERTMNVICIDLKAYADELNGNNSTSSMDAFVEEHIFHWIRMICAHVPDSEFVFVGTKLDLIDHSEEQLQKISEDLQQHLDKKEKDAVYELEQVLDKLKAEYGKTTEPLKRDQITQLEVLIKKRPRFMTTDFVAVSSSDFTGVDGIRKSLQKWIVKSDSSFPMPEVYARVGAFIARMKKPSSVKGHQYDLGSTFQKTSDICGAVVKAFPQYQLVERSVKSVLRVLHLLGDMLWFSDAPNDVLSDMVFLDPETVLDLIRRVINHKLGDVDRKETNDALTTAVIKEGRVDHNLLRTLEFWNEISDSTVMKQLKELLFHFNLAYPDDVSDDDGSIGEMSMTAFSDLIVPMYWNVRNNEHDEYGRQHTRSAELPERVCWEYKFFRYLPDSLFEKLIVKSYSTCYSNSRSFTRYSFKTHEKEVHSAYVSRARQGESVYVRIDIHASSMAIAWEQLVWYSINMEALLEKEYPGLFVKRYAVSDDGTPYEIARLVSQRNKKHMANSAAKIRVPDATSSLLPPDMDWYTRKCWKNPSLLDSEMSPEEKNYSKKRMGFVRSKSQSETVMIKAMGKMSAQLETVIETVDGLVQHTNQLAIEQTHLHDGQGQIKARLDAVGNTRDYPAVWTLTYNRSSTSVKWTYTLEMKCHVSGVCYHDPIKISVLHGFLGKHANVLQRVFQVTMSVLTQQPVDMRISALDSAAIAEGVATKLRLSDEGSIDGNERNGDISSDESVAMLKDLLRLHDDSFDPIKMSGYSGLECAIIEKTGQHIWVGSDEIEKRYPVLKRRNAIQDAVALPNELPNAVHDQSAGDPALPGAKQGQSHGDQEQPKAVEDHAKPDDVRKLVQLSIVKATDLSHARRWGSQKLRCEWWITDHEDKTVHEGSTEVIDARGSSRRWDYDFLVDTDLRAFCMHVEVVAKRKFGRKKAIGQGNVTVAKITRDNTVDRDVPLRKEGGPAGSVQVKICVVHKKTKPVSPQGK